MSTTSRPDDSTVPGEQVTLVPLAHVSVAPGERYAVRGGPFGDRVIAGISAGRWEGERLTGDIVGPGGDWAKPGPGDAMLLDVRQVVQTDDGAVIYVTYSGRCDRSRGSYTVAPTFETSDERYTWLNAVQAVGKGTFSDGRLHYDMYEVR